MNRDRLQDLQEIGIGYAYLANNGKVITERQKNKLYRVQLKCNFASYTAEALSLLDAINLVIKKIEDMNID